MIKHFFLFLLILVFCKTSPAQSYKLLHDELMALIDKDEIEKAIPIAEKTSDAALAEFGENSSKFIVSLNTLADLYSDVYKYDKVEPLLLRVAGILEKEFGQNNEYYADALNRLARFYSFTGVYSMSEELFLKSLGIHKLVVGEDNDKYAQGLNDLAVTYSYMGEYEKAEPLLIQARDIYKKIKGLNSADYAMSLNNLAATYSDLGQYQKAEPLYMQAKDIRRNLFGEDHPDYANSLNNLGFFFSELGEFEKSLIYYQQALAIRKKVLGESHPDYSVSLNNMAKLYHDIGRYDKAEPLYLQAKELAKKVLGLRHPDYAVHLNNLGLLYLSMGQYEKAEVLFLEAISNRKASLGMEHPEYAGSLNSLGGAYMEMKQYDKALAFFTEAKNIRIKVRGEEHIEVAESLNNLAELYADKKDYKNAEYNYNRSVAIRKKTLGTHHPGYAVGISNLAVFYMIKGDYEKAERLFIEARDIYKKAYNERHPYYANSIRQLANLYSATGQYEKAVALTILNSRIIIENLLDNFSILSEKEKGNYLKNNVSVIENNNSILYYYPKASPALYNENINLLLLLKSLSLSGTKEMLNTVRNSLDSNIQKKFGEWMGIKNMLAKQYSLAVEKQRPDLKKMEAEAESLEKELSRRSSTFQNQQKKIQITVSDIRAQLEADEVAIEFVRFRLFNGKWLDSVMYAAYIINKNELVSVFVPLCEEKQLLALFVKAGKNSTSMVSSFYRGLGLKNKVAAPLGRELYNLIWQPLEPYLKGIKKISYSPAGNLYQIAFHALPIDSIIILSDRYLLNQFRNTREIALRKNSNQSERPLGISLFGDASFTMDSVQLIRQLKTPTRNEKSASAIYYLQKRNSQDGSWPDLPGTAEEVKLIKNLFDQNRIPTGVFVRTAASEENLKSLDDNSQQVLHMATHGFFLTAPESNKKTNEAEKQNSYKLAEDPLLRSGLVLAGGNYTWNGKAPIEGLEDGIVTAYEISQLNLSKTAIVVLSACETALGDVKGTEGVFGLQRAFKMAGVNKMILSLWQVPDKETAELMNSFYTYWINGSTIKNSFLKAQADMRKKYSPFYWAAFVLIE